MKTNFYASLSLALVMLQACQVNQFETVRPSDGGTSPAGTRTAAAAPRYDVLFGWGTKYDDGQQPSIAAYSGGVIEVHKAETEVATDLWYRFGSRKGAAIDWAPAHQYDKGREPSVAVNKEGDVIEVHETSNITSNTLWCRVGRADANAMVVNWRAGQEIALKPSQGHKPSVALATQRDGEKLAVIVLQSESNQNLNWVTGFINQQGKFEEHWAETYDKGLTPSVSMNSSGQVIEVHKSQSQDALFYRIGYVDKWESNILGFKKMRTIVRWHSSYMYDRGVQPSVALGEDGTVVEVHKSQYENTLWRRVGRINGSQIEWTIGSQEFDRGKLPVVTRNASNDNFEHSHEGESTYTLWYSNAKFWDRSNWMGDLASRQGHLTLKDISMPGSHDAGMYTGLGGVSAITQDENLYRQLQNGVRYFDLRCDKNLVIRHGSASGPSVETVLNDVRSFMDEGHKEVVVLTFTHFKETNFLPEEYPNEFSKLLGLVQQKLGPYLFTNTTSSSLIQIPLRTFLTSNTGKVLVVFSHHDGSKGLPNNLYKYWNKGPSNSSTLGVQDEYSNTTSYSKMKDDQIGKFNKFTNTDRLFVFSWTLTPYADAYNISPSVRTLAGTCNPHLARELKDRSSISSSKNTYGQKMNVLYVDFHQYARVADICWYMNNN